MLLEKDTTISAGWQKEFSQCISRLTDAAYGRSLTEIFGHRIFGNIVPNLYINLLTPVRLLT